MFGIKPLQQIGEFADVDDVIAIRKQVEEGDYKLVAIPTNYSIAQTKVDVESLKSCLMAFDLKQQGLDI